MTEVSVLPAVKDWLTVVALCASLLTPIVLLWLKSQFASRESIEKLTEKFAAKDVAIQTASLAARLDILEDRVSRVEGNVEHLPDKDETHKMALKTKLGAETPAMLVRMAVSWFGETA